MAFLRFSRDKRGYESIYLVEPTDRRDKSRSKILYWFRTPPGVRVGREPFDDQARRAIEAQNPRIFFDWKKLVATPMPLPAPDVEHWRERRKMERAAKQAARREAEEEAAAAAPANAAVPPATASAESALDASDEVETAAEAEGEQDGGPLPAVGASASQPTGKRRRRRRKRGGAGRPQVVAGAAALSGTPAPQEPRESVEPGEPGEPVDR